MITGKRYDWLKLLAQIILPAVGTLYYILAGLLELGETDNVVGTIMAIDLGLGVFLWISQRVYAQNIGQGDLVVEDDAMGEPSMRLELDHTPEELADKREVRFKVKKTTKLKRRST
jgi:hypothetical protein